MSEKSTRETESPESSSVLALPDMYVPATEPSLARRISAASCA
jgi:hypothetical protein